MHKSSESVCLKGISGITGWSYHGVRIESDTIESFPDQELASGHHGDSWTNKPAKHDDRVSPLSPH